MQGHQAHVVCLHVHFICMPHLQALCKKHIALVPGKGMGEDMHVCDSTKLTFSLIHRVPPVRRAATWWWPAASTISASSTSTSTTASSRPTWSTWPLTRPRWGSSRRWCRASRAGSRPGSRPAAPATRPSPRCRGARRAPPGATPLSEAPCMPPCALLHAACWPPAEQLHKLCQMLEWTSKHEDAAYCINSA